MRKVLAVASVGAQHKELVLKDLKNIFRRIKIPLDILLQEEINNQDESKTIISGSLFKQYPCITLTIPNYEQHREYLEKVYKNNVLFSKFILLISKGDNYQELITNRNQQILRQQCRNWNMSVSCSFQSTPVFTDLEDQVSKIDKIFGQMDIRGKITKIDAQKQFHLIENHPKDVDDPHPVKDTKLPNSNKNLFKLFFGLELIKCGRGGRWRGAAGGIIIAADSRYSYSSQFMEYQEETSTGEYMMSDMDINIRDCIIQNRCSQPVNEKTCSTLVSSLRGKKPVQKRLTKRRVQKTLVKEEPKSKNPYLKKLYHDQVSISQTAMIQE